MIIFYKQSVLTVKSQASAHTQASALPPILAVSVLWVVLRVTAHHAICAIV